MALTAHWIAKANNDSMLVLKTALLAFHHIPGSHDGQSLGSMMLYLLDRADTAAKVSTCLYRVACSDIVQTGHFTLDNAGNNQTAMQELSNLLGQRGIDFDSVEHRIPCIINICMKHVIDEYAAADYSTVADTWMVEDQIIKKVDYVQAVQAKPLERARNIVRLIRASNQRRDRFRECILRGNEDGWF
jgi:hypothetical protein